MNQKRNQIEVSGCKIRVESKTLDQKSPGSNPGGTTIFIQKSNFSSDLFSIKIYQTLTPSSNQKENQRGVSDCRAIGERVIYNQLLLMLSPATYYCQRIKRSKYISGNY